MFVLQLRTEGEEGIMTYFILSCREIFIGGGGCLVCFEAKLFST